MATMASRKARGAESQRIVAQSLRDDGWPYAEPVGAGLAGVDITGTPAVAIEVKARAGLDLPGWLRQTARNANELDVPVLIVRPNGFGPVTVDGWAAITPFAWMRRLLRQAGYGTPHGPSDPGVTR